MWQLGILNFFKKRKFLLVGYIIAPNPRLEMKPLYRNSITSKLSSLYAFLANQHE